MEEEEEKEEEKKGWTAVVGVGGGDGFGLGDLGGRRGKRWSPACKVGGRKRWVGKMEVCTDKKCGGPGLNRRTVERILVIRGRSRQAYRQTMPRKQTVATQRSLL